MRSAFKLTVIFSSFFALSVKATTLPVPTYVPPNEPLVFSNLANDGYDAFRTEMLKRLWFISNYLGFEQDPKITTDHFLVFGLTNGSVTPNGQIDDFIDTFMDGTPEEISDQTDVFFAFLKQELLKPELAQLRRDYGNKFPTYWNDPSSAYEIYFSWLMFDGATVTESGKPDLFAGLYKYQDPGSLNCSGLKNDGFDAARMDLIKRMIYFHNHNSYFAIDSYLMIWPFGIQILGGASDGWDAFFEAFVSMLSNQIAMDPTFAAEMLRFEAYLSTQGRRPSDLRGEFDNEEVSFNGRLGFVVDDVTCGL